MTKNPLKPGLSYEFKFKIPESKTVPRLYPESPEFQLMPKVLATGFMIGLIEWACIKAINAHLDWPEEQTVGTHVNISHAAATPPGLVVTVQVKLIEVAGRRLIFDVEAHDGMESIGKGTHERFIINKKRFDEKVSGKAVKNAERLGY